MIRRIPLAFLLVPLLCTSSWAEPPASASDPSDEGARQSFERFAGEWMAHVQEMEEQQREHPSVRPGAKEPIVTFRGYGDDYSIELRPTGHAAAPYIGLLRYVELVYSCGAPSDCTVASSVPVTEIFRFQDGRWIY